MNTTKNYILLLFDLNKNIHKLRKNLCLKQITLPNYFLPFYYSQKPPNIKEKI